MTQKSALRSERLHVPEDLDEFNAFIAENRWGDGLPCVPPTAQRVERMIAASGRRADEVIGRIPPNLTEATVERIAVNAVMAGALPEYLPVIIAAMEASCEPSFNCIAMQCTATSACPMLVINGPIRQKLGINCSRGCFGPGWRPNATIGRGTRFALQNIGGAYPAQESLSYHSWPAKYTFCYGEDEERSAWAPLHVRRGFKKEDSTVTIVAVLDLRTEGTTMEKGPLNWLYKIALALTTHGNLHACWRMGEPYIVVSPKQTEMFLRDGFTPEKCQEVLFQECRIPIKDYERTSGGLSHPAHGGIEGDHIRVFQSPKDFVFVVAGGPEVGMLNVFATWYSSRSSTRKIVEPAGPS